MSDVKEAPAQSVASPAGGAGLSARQVQIRSAIQALGMLPVLIILAIAFHYASDARFLTAQNLSIVSQQAAINIVLSSGMTFVILTGGIDLSVGSILAASAMAALMASLVPGVGWIGVPVGVLTGLVFGLINGGLIAFGKLPPFIVTLGMLTAVRGIARLMGHDATLFNQDLPFAFIGNSSIPLAPGVHVPFLAVIALVVILVSW